MYTVENTSCNCHPETCSCPEYEIVKTYEKTSFTVARGSNLLDLQIIVDAANAVDGLEDQIAMMKERSK